MQVLVEVESKFPAALKRNSTEDEVELNVDVIPAPLLGELAAFIATAKKRKTGNANKKAKTKAATNWYIVATFVEWLNFEIRALVQWCNYIVLATVLPDSFHQSFTRYNWTVFVCARRRYSLL